MTKIVRKRLEFAGTLGNRLAARLDLPGDRPRAFVLFAHCFTCTKDLKAARRLANALAEHGFGVMRFDFTGLGESEGDFADTDFRSNIDDLVAAADFLRVNFEAPRVLVGHSLGGTAMLAAAARIPESIAVATIGAPSDTTHLGNRLLRLAPELEEKDEAEVLLQGRPFRIRRQLVDDLRETSVSKAIRGLARALLVMHSPVDEVVAIDHARQIYEQARHPKSFVALDGADHLLLRRESDARYAGEILSAWASRYLDSRDPEPAPPATPSGEVVVRGGQRGFSHEILAGGHRFRADEPVSAGGTDEGPNPYDLLLASLGACTAMTLRLYADRKKWKLEEVEIRLRHARIHARDCEDCDTSAGRLDEIRREIAIRGELNVEQRERLLDIAERCPVHRTLTGPVRIRSVARTWEETAEDSSP